MCRVSDSTLLARSMIECPAFFYDKDTVVLKFLGDVMLHQAQIDNARIGDGLFDFSDCFSDMEDDLANADIAVANMEFTLAGKPYTGYPAFSAPDSYAEYMAQCGIDVFLTANNHILDKGERGLSRTLSVYRHLEDKYGIRMTGSAENADAAFSNYPLFATVKGMKIAFVNFTYGTNIRPGMLYPGTNYTDREQIVGALRRAEALGADFIIVLPHWGEEYSTTHSESQEDLACLLAENGADLIAGAHPHVVQDVGWIECGSEDGACRKIPVIYSLGNAISNMSAPNTQIGLLLTVRLVRNAFGDVECMEPEFDFIWSSLPGRLKESHSAAKVKDLLGHPEKWMMRYEYDKMVSTYYRIKDLTGIDD